MTRDDFSLNFDILYNNVTANQAPGLDEKEKSVFLTKAQDEILKAYFNPLSSKTFEGYDSSQRRQIDFSMVMSDKTYEDREEETVFGDATIDFHANSKSVVIETDIMMFINESVTVMRGEDVDIVDEEEVYSGGREITLQTVPISYYEYTRLMTKPFKRPTQYQAWRLLKKDDSGRKAELIVGPEDRIIKYVIRYVKRPNKIDLESDSDEPCELDESLHQDILQRAVELAKVAYMGDLQAQVALGATSQTNIGIQSNR